MSENASQRQRVVCFRHSEGVPLDFVTFAFSCIVSPSMDEFNHDFRHHRFE
jgi:hypothetical protein